MAVAPEDFPPQFDSNDYIGPPTDAEDERLEVGIVIVGGGPAGLACANQVMQLLEDEPELTEKLGEVPVAVVEKGKVCGAHGCGANVVPTALEGLFPDRDRTTGRSTGGNRRHRLPADEGAALPLKPMPPNFTNHGNYTMSVSQAGAFPG